MTNKKTPPKPKKKNKGGRPKVVIDYSMLDKYCAIQCTGEECAALLDMSYDSLDRCLKRDKKGGFAEYFRKKSVFGKASLRRTQFTTAEGGNATMQIWLGKQWLGQREPEKTEPDEDTGQKIDVTFSVSEPVTDVRVTSGS